MVRISCWSEILSCGLQHIAAECDAALLDRSHCLVRSPRQQGCLEFERKVMSSENFHISISDLENFLMTLGYQVWQDV